MTENQNNKSNGTNRAKFHRRNNKRDKFDPNRFYWCYGKGDIPEGMELVASSKNVITCEGTMSEQAKGQLRSDIRSLGGNAAMGLSIERSGTVRRTFVAGYNPATITASAYAALILPKRMSQKEKEEREGKFKSADKVTSENSPSLTTDSLVIGLVVAILFCCIGLVGSL